MFNNLSSFILPALVEYLASTIKNRDSERARRIFKIVGKLHQATTQFLATFDQNGNLIG